jgi:trans-2,3-dihydro-3-hydroxyanthranilate isomerase
MAIVSGRDYAIYDVFTQKAMAGNPLAVVFDAQGLTDQDMLAIAGEFNLSETVFITPADKAQHLARLRIFTPRKELPFAGHPTVGAAIALVERDGLGADRIVVLEENAGDVRCALHGDAVTYAEFDAPVMPQLLDVPLDRDALADALGLVHDDMYLENHAPVVATAGNAFAFIPVKGLDAMNRIRVNTAALEALGDAAPGEPVEPYVYCRETVSVDCAFHARMFAPHMGIVEDPATGSAVAAFSRVIEHFDGLANGPSVFWVEQGMEMGRPSRIRLEATAANGVISAIRIGGHAVKVAQGRLLV